MTNVKPVRSLLPTLACCILSATIYAPSMSAAATHLGELQPLLTTDTAVGDQFGFSAAVSSDGTTAIVGACTKNNNVGAAYIFTGASGSWTQQAELTESDPGRFDFFGCSVALSADGNTALVGAYAKSNSKGAAYVFIRSGTEWKQQAELAAGDGTLFDRFGYSVALSADGNTALISAVGKSGSQGAAYVFTRSDPTWTQQQELIAAMPGNGDQMGYSVALSADGSTALLGAPGRNGTAGAAYVFSLSGTTSTQQELDASDGQPNDQLGRWVALSADGKTALFGVVTKAYVYSLANGTWTKLVPSDAFQGVVGSTVALSSDGNIALLGAYQENNLQGAAYIFTRDNAGWTQQKNLTASESVAGDQVGWSVGLSADGSVALLGATNPMDMNATGAAYIFTADVIAPKATPVQSPPANSAGWNNSEVLVTWKWMDNPGGSGVDPANCTTSSTSTGEGYLTVTATCSDMAGNIGTASANVNVDTTNPTVIASGKNADGTIYNAGSWTNKTVTVTFACTDAGSGIASCSSSQDFPVSTALATGTGVDVAGNSSTANFGPIQIDRIPPTISAALLSSPNAAGWYNTNVTVHFTCHDADSGFAACPADQILTAEGTAVLSAAATVQDTAGNTSAPSNTYTVKIDKTNPTVIYTGNLATYGVDQTVTITCTASDALSGIATTTCSNISGDAYAIGVGSHSYSASAADVAGNTGNGSTTFSIVVTFSGVINLVNRWETKSGIAAQMVTTLQGAQAAFASGAVTSGDNQLNSFIRQVSSQSGKSLTAAQANLLIQYAQALMK